MTALGAIGRPFAVFFEEVFFRSHPCAHLDAVPVDAARFDAPHLDAPLDGEGACFDVSDASLARDE